MNIIWGLIIWHIIGILIYCTIAAITTEDYFIPIYGWELVNPYWIYNNFKVNVFGAIVLSIIFGILCPIGTVIYWFYKLCTVGRK